MTKRIENLFTLNPNFILQPALHSFRKEAFNTFFKQNSVKTSFTFSIFSNEAREQLYSILHEGKTNQIGQKLNFIPAGIKAS